MQNELLHYFYSAVSVAGLSQGLWLIIALPLFGAFVVGVFGRWLGRANVNLIACASVFAAFILSVLVFIALNDFTNQYRPPGLSEPLLYTLGRDYGQWFTAGHFTARYGLLVDHLSGTLLLVITGVGFLIHLYSTAYMEHDPGYWRYFAYLNLFVAMMLTLVMADNLVLTFVGWEGVGFCSYLLIGFWYSDAAKAWAGRKAFVTNRIGDFGFVLGMMLLTLLVGSFLGARESTANFGGNPNAKVEWNRAVDRGVSRPPASEEATGPLSYANLEVFARSLSSGAGITLSTPVADGPLKGMTYGGVLTAVMLLFLLGATGKSAQLPLYVWLPDAMAGPTPVSALIHAATMVTAGVYLFCRLSFLLVLSPATMATLAIVGALTALLAALIAFAQDDIKKVLAYSTVSQLGFMFMAVGMGVFWAGVLHLVTHAFFKACLFLGAGSVMHGNGDETDIKRLGGLKAEMPITWATFGIATVAITGVLPLSGFFSKDAILHGVSETTLAGIAWAPKLVWALGLVSALCTAFYMTRLYLLTFEGKRSEKAKVPHAHESSWPMSIPLIILAGLSILAIVHGLPIMVNQEGQRQFVMENYLSPVFAAAREISERTRFVEHEGFAFGPLLVAYVVALLIAWAGAGAAWYAYTRLFPARAKQPVPALARTVRGWAQAKFYVDELYDRLVIRPFKGLSFLFYKVVDTFFIDTLAVRGTAWVTARMGAALRFIQTGDVQSYAVVMAVGLLVGAGFALFQVLK